MYQNASLFKRFIALIIDGMIISIIAKVITFPFGWTFNPFHIFDNDIWYYVRFSGWTGFIGLIYYVYLESSWRSATFGKQAMHIVVLDEDRNRLTLAKSLLRNLTKVICGNIFILGYFFAFFNKEKQALHDLIGTTIVVDDQPT